jgi:drug/metabolite transporter (DMT)-like permease
MTASATTAARARIARPAIGIALMASAALLLPLVDLTAKVLMASHAPLFLAWARYASAAVLIVPLSALHERRTPKVRMDFAPNALRTVLSLAAMLCFFFALTDTKLATAFGGYFVGPVVAALLATRFLGEKATAARVIAAVAGLAGAFLIIQPGAEFQLGSLLAVLSGVLFAGYLLATRMAASTTPPVAALRFQYVLGALLLTPFALSAWSWPGARDLLLVAAMGGLSTLCHLMTILAFRHAGAAVLSPLIYLELVTAVILGWRVLGELPDAMALGGIACIAAGGLLIVLSERRTTA